jgi:hypothetical protein
MLYRHRLLAVHIFKYYTCGSFIEGGFNDQDYAMLSRPQASNTLECRGSAGE